MSTGTIGIGPAKPEEWAATFRLLFPGDLDISQRIDRAAQMIQSGALDPDSVRVAREGDEIIAAMLAAAVPGNGAIVWPPRSRPGLIDCEFMLHSLCADATAWLQSRGTRLAQALLPKSESALAKPLLQSGFRRTTRLVYMRHFLELTLDQLATPDRCDYRTYKQLGEPAFVTVMDRTHEGSLDCPEINGVRSGVEMLAGHRAVGPFDPERWWIARFDGEDIGVVLTTSPEPNAWDVAYLGVVPAARRRGIGAELIRKVLFEAKAAAVPMVTLAVDERNHPAQSLYRAAGFEVYDELDVYLRIFDQA